MSVSATVGNVRSGAGLQHRVVGVLRKGAEVKGTWTSNGWLKMAGDRLERYGYAMDAGRPRISTPVVLSCRYLEHPPRRLVAMLTNPKGHRFALETVRLNLTIRLGL